MYTVMNIALCIELYAEGFVVFHVCN